MSGYENSLVEFREKKSCYDLEQESANYHPRAKCGWQPVFVNKIFLEYSHIHPFT